MPDQVADELKPCEEWKAIPGYEGYYDVSCCGRVRSWYTGGGHRLLVPHIKKVQRDKDGYPFVLLYKHRDYQGFRVARLVLYAFVGMCKQGMEASHVDGNKQNNSLENLCWETRLENEQRKKQHGTRPHGEDNSSSKITALDVREMRRLRQAGEKLLSLAGRFGISEANVSLICLGRTWQHVK